jgi:hypothetical protein
MITFTDFLNFYIKAKKIEYSKKNIPSNFLSLAYESTKFNLILLVEFMKNNKHLFTGKQSKRVIKDFLIKNQTFIGLKDILSKIKLSQILECSSFTRLEFIQTLNQSIHKALTFNKPKSTDYFLFYRNKFLVYEDSVSASFCNLMDTIKSEVFSSSSDISLMETLYEMFLNNCIKDFQCSYASTCYSYFKTMKKILMEEPIETLGLPFILNIVTKFKEKFYCESVAIKFLSQLTVIESKMIYNKLKVMDNLSLVYLKVLLENEPNLEDKLSYRFNFLKSKSNLNHDNENLESLHKINIDYFRLNTIHEKIVITLKILRNKFSDQDISPTENYVNWNFPTLTHLSEVEMNEYLKDSYCSKLHLSTQGYLEFYKIDNYWISKGVQKIIEPSPEILIRFKVIQSNDLKFTLNNEKFGTFWGYKCLDEYKIDCNNATKCSLDESLETNNSKKDKLSKCILKREVYQYGNTSKHDKAKIQSHFEQINQKIDQLQECNDIMYTQKNVL